MKRGRRRTCDWGRRGEISLGIRQSRIPMEIIVLLGEGFFEYRSPNMTNGRFYLRKTDNGNLLGEWSNDSTPGIFTESCDLNVGSGQCFCGTYFSTWREEGRACFATLTITKPGHVFVLEWRGNDGNFDGHGMLQSNEVLVGDYHSSNPRPAA